MNYCAAVQHLWTTVFRIHRNWFAGVGFFVGMYPVPATEPALEVDIGAPPRAETFEFRINLIPANHTFSATHDLSFPDCISTTQLSASSET